MSKPEKKNLFLPSLEQRKKLQKVHRLVKRFLHVGQPDEEYAWEVQLCNLVTWVGALAVTAVVLRSLYLMYLTPEAT